MPEQPPNSLEKLKEELRKLLARLQDKSSKLTHSSSRLQGTLSESSKLEKLIQEVQKELQFSRVKAGNNFKAQKEQKLKELIERAKKILGEGREREVFEFELIEPSWVSGVVECQTDKAEDAPPLALHFKDGSGSKITALAVADGMGGAGSHRFGEETHAYHASRASLKAVQTCLLDSGFCQALISDNPAQQARVGKLIYDKFTEIIKAKIAANPKNIERRIKSPMLFDFPTTLSLAVIVRQADGQNFLVTYTLGDSPVIIIKGREVSTINYTSESGDAVLGKKNSLNYSSESNFQINRQALRGGETVFASTDWIVKLSASINNSEIYQKLLDGLSPEAIREYYTGEGDDATVAYSKV